MKLQKIGLLTGAMLAMGSMALADTGAAVSRNLADWVSLVAEILSFVCLTIFIIYAGRLLNTNKGQASSEEDATATRVNAGVKNGIMTALVGIALCQAVIIVAQALFAK